MIFIKQESQLVFTFSQDDVKNGMKYAICMKGNKSRFIELELKNNIANFTFPSARVPIVWELYSITPKGEKKLTYKIVSYPVKSTEPSGAITEMISMKSRIWAYGTPNWFSEWSFAIGLNFKPADTIKELLAGLKSPKQILSHKDIIVMGYQSAGKTFEEFLEIIKQLPADVGIIVLDAQWLERVPEKSNYYSAKSTFKKDLVAGECEYSSPPPYYSANVAHYPLKYVTNRVFLVQGKNHEIFSEVIMPDLDRAVILSYIDLSKVLGDDVIYDNYFLSLFIEASKNSKWLPNYVPDRNLQWLWSSKLEKVFESVDFDKPHSCVYLADDSKFASDRPEKSKAKEIKQKAMDNFSDRLIVLSNKPKQPNGKHEADIDLTAKECLWGAELMNRLTCWGIKLKSKKFDINLKGEEK